LYFNLSEYEREQLRRMRPTLDAVLGVSERLGKLRELALIQREHGNWNFDAYMHGMANGLQLAVAVMEDREPEYLKAPPRWLCDVPSASPAQPSPPSP
jgi:hypothetical protein